jgi:hypothetical protein
MSQETAGVVRSNALAVRGWLRRAATAEVAPFVLLAGVYVLARVIAFDGAEAREFHDTIDYKEVADAPILSKKFLAGDHPPTVPLVYKLLGTGDRLLAGQLVFSIACWLALAAATASTLRDRRVRVVAFAAILAFSLSQGILLWDSVLLSESVSISLTAALVAAWLLFIRRPALWSLALVLVLTGFWGLARDPHAYVLLLVAAVLGASLLLRGQRLLKAVAIAGVVAVAAISFVSASAWYKRWQYPLQNIVALRISADPGALRHFERAGMPVTQEFVDLSRQYRADGVDPFHHPAAYGAPEFRAEFLPFQVWLMEEGRHTYVEYLLTHPGYVAKGLDEIDHILLDPSVSSYRSERPPSRFRVLPDLVYPASTLQMLLYLALAVALAAAVAVRKRPPTTWALPIFLALSSLPFALVVWHGEVLEPDRKGLIPSQFLRLGTLLLVLMAVDELVRRRRA